MRALSITLLATISLLAIGSASADDLTAANSAFDRKDYSAAFEFYGPLARAGSAPAQSAIGSMYYFGNGVEKNWSRAYMWFSLAAQSSSATGVVASANRDVLRRLMVPADVKLAESMADRCLASRYEQCGLILYAQR